MHNINILIVDDDKVILDIVRIWFKTYGYNVETAENAEDALELINKKPFDVLISDVHMDGMSGKDLANIVNKEKPHINIILMSAYSRLLDTEQDKYLKISKPFKMFEVLKIVEKSLNNKNQFN